VQTGAAVFQGVMQAFLCDSEKTQRDVIWQMRWNVFVFEVNADLVLLGKFLAKAPDAGCKAKIIKLRGCNSCESA